MNDESRSVLESARRQIAAQSGANPFLDLLDAGRVPVRHLGSLAGELYHLVRSDRRSFALLAARFPDPPAGGLLLAMAAGEDEALRLLFDFAAALELTPDDLARHEPRPLAQAYPAFLAQVAIGGTRSDIALALLANVADSGGTYRRAVEALRGRYGLPEQALGHFHYFADTPQEVLDQAMETLRVGLAAGDDPVQAVRTARMVHAFEATFWQTLADGLAG